MIKPENKLSVYAVAALLAALGTTYTFFDTIHAQYVTKDEMSVKILELENKYLVERQVILREIEKQIDEKLGTEYR